MALCFYKKQIHLSNDKLKWKVSNTACDKNGRILILDAELNDTNFLLINFYNSNTESEKLSTFSTLQKLLEKLDDYNKKSFWMLF